jgi:integrase
MGTRAKVISAAAHVDMKRAAGLYPVAKATGLYLQVSKAGTKSWVYRFTLCGNPREMGLGSVAKVSLADARKASTAAAALRDKGIDPIDARRAERAEKLAARQAAKIAKPNWSNTFKNRAERYIDGQAPGWKRKDAATLWRNPFAKWIYPVIGDMEIADIRLSHVAQALAAPWHKVPETARRLRARVERIFNAAIAEGAYERANPAAAALVLTQLPRQKREIEHFPAAKLKDAPALYQTIAAAPGTVHRAHQFMILTTARPSEALNAKWSEIDFTARTWTVPKERAKAGREHIVPLSDGALAVLDAQAKVRMSDCIFPGQRADSPLSYNVFATALFKLGIKNVTPHSWRSSFRDWAGDVADVPRDLAEAQLAHALNGTEGAYRRLTAVEKRRAVLANYAAWLAGATADNVVVFPNAKAV